MIIGCFALVEPFATMERQFEALAEMGITHADLTDSHDGGSLGVEFGFTASVSLDIHPGRIREMTDRCGITLSAVCAHANLLDPTDPSVYGTAQIIKAVRLAHLLGITEVITTEGEPNTSFGRGLDRCERLFSIREKLQAPLAWAEELGVQLLLESHGPVTDSIEDMGDLLDSMGHEDILGVCLDTGNSWLGGADPVAYARAFGPRIRHVHWKDMPAEAEAGRGNAFGCGMASIAVGDGVVDISGVLRELHRSGFDGATTLEVAGAENVKRSIQRLNQWLAEG
jgi:inosose dehydratase